MNYYISLFELTYQTALSFHFHQVYSTTIVMTHQEMASFIRNSSETYESKWTSVPEAAAVVVEYRESMGLGATLVVGFEVRIEEMRRLIQLRDQEVTREISAMVWRGASRASDWGVERVGSRAAIDPTPSCGRCEQCGAARSHSWSIVVCWNSWFSYSLCSTQKNTNSYIVLIPWTSV